MAKLKFILDLPINEFETEMIRKEVCSIDQSAQIKFISDSEDPDLYYSFVVKTRKEEALENHQFDSCVASKVK